MRVLAAAFGALFALPAAAADRFPDPARLDAKLVRGSSTKADVLLVLGEPQGSGGAVVPTARGVHDIWYYEDSGGTAGLFSSSLRQNILLIFFRGDKYDGYLWFRNRAEATMR